MHTSQACTMADEQRQLSLKLWDVLENIGVSESSRWIYRDMSFSREIIKTISENMVGRKVSEYIFGSSCEGTTTPGMGSDSDVVLCDDEHPVITSIQEAPSGESYLMVTDPHTSPGYAKLQVVRNKIPLTTQNSDIHHKTKSALPDCHGRICVRHVSYQDRIDSITERCGPADTTSGHPHVASLDRVVAVRCRIFPDIAKNSFEGFVKWGWMSREEINNLMSLGILLVGVGHPSSPEFDIEWRISFSLQERQLMLRLNQTQHNCYVMLKMVKNMITANSGISKSLTSYHCKTCLFFVTAHISPKLWLPENLIKCTFVCLNVIKHWVYIGVCPNFFIKQNNMFERRIYGAARKTLLQHLRFCVHEGLNLFFRIKSDNLGDALSGLPCERNDRKHAKMRYAFNLWHCRATCGSQREILEMCYRFEHNFIINHYLCKELSRLQSLDTITEHSHKETRMAGLQLEPMVHKLCAQTLASMAFSQEEPEARATQFETISRHLELGRNWDTLSGRLMEATILFRDGKLQSCCTLLEQTEKHVLNEAVVSICTCYKQTSAYTQNEHLARKILDGAIDHRNMMELAVASCTIFLPSHREIIPKALEYELYRSIDATTEIKHDDTTFNRWFDWAVVDSKIFLYFMQYLVYSDVNESDAKRRTALEQIWKTLLHDRNLGHRETAYNLLGWIYIREWRIPEAVECLRKSWEIRPDLNAAKWHVQVFDKKRRRHMTSCRE